MLITVGYIGATLNRPDLM